MNQAILIESGDTTHEVKVLGEGKTVVLRPALSRSSSYFDALAKRLAKGGYRAVLPERRGVGRSTGPLEGLTLRDLSGDVAAIIAEVGGAPVSIVGHAFGNRVARLLAAEHPELVESIVLLAAGGKIPPTAEIQQAMQDAWSVDLTKDQREQATRKAYFAPGFDPSAIMERWQAETVEPGIIAAHAPAGATARLEDWWTAGNSVPILVIQGRHDVVAVPENARLLKEEAGDRVSIVEVVAGHALLPEAPVVIADAILGFLA